SGLVPNAQPGLARQFANFLLGETSLQERSSNPMLPRGDLAGTKISLVVRVNAVGDGIKAAPPAHFLHHSKQLVFAVETAGGIVADVLRALEFRGGDDFER